MKTKVLKRVKYGRLTSFLKIINHDLLVLKENKVIGESIYILENLLTDQGLSNINELLILKEEFFNESLKHLNQSKKMANSLIYLVSTKPKSYKKCGSTFSPCWLLPKNYNKFLNLLFNDNRNQVQNDFKIKLVQLSKEIEEFEIQMAFSKLRSSSISNLHITDKFEFEKLSKDLNQLVANYFEVKEQSSKFIDVINSNLKRNKEHFNILLGQLKGLLNYLDSRNDLDFLIHKYKSMLKVFEIELNQFIKDLKQSNETDSELNKKKIHLLEQIIKKLNEINSEPNKEKNHLPNQLTIELKDKNKFQTFKTQLTEKVDSPEDIKSKKEKFADLLTPDCSKIKKKINSSGDLESKNELDLEKIDSKKPCKKLSEEMLSGINKLENRIDSILTILPKLENQIDTTLNILPELEKINEQKIIELFKKMEKDLILIKTEIQNKKGKFERVEETSYLDKIDQMALNDQEKSEEHRQITKCLIIEKSLSKKIKICLFRMSKLIDSQFKIKYSNIKPDQFFDNEFSEFLFFEVIYTLRRFAKERDSLKRIKDKKFKTDNEKNDNFKNENHMENTNCEGISDDKKEVKGEDKKDNEANNDEINDEDKISNQSDKVRVKVLT